MRVVLQNAAALLLGTTCFPLPPAQCGWLILGGMIVNRNVTECGCRLSSLVLADIIDEDRAMHSRSKPMSSSIAGANTRRAAPSFLFFSFLSLSSSLSFPVSRMESHA
jgi:hypothetical protein